MTTVKGRFRKQVIHLLSSALVMLNSFSALEGDVNTPQDRRQDTTELVRSTKASTAKIFSWFNYFSQYNEGLFLLFTDLIRRQKFQQDSQLKQKVQDDLTPQILDSRRIHLQPLLLNKHNA